MTTSSKRLFAIKPSAASETEAYQVPTSTEAGMQLFVCNQSPDTATTVNVALTDGDTPVTAEYIMYGASIPAASTITINGIQLQTGYAVWVYATDATVSFVGVGVEKGV
jgi:hypothetical protein